MVQALRIRSRYKGAVLVGMVAYGNDEIPIDPLVLIHMIGGMAGDVDTVLFHDSHSTWIEPMCFDPCRVNVGFTVCELF